MRTGLHALSWSATRLALVAALLLCLALIALTGIVVVVVVGQAVSTFGQ